MEGDGITSDIVPVTAKNDEKLSRIIIPKRKIVVEPILIILSLFGFPLMQVSQLYINERLEEYVKDEFGYNETFSVSGNSSNSSKCDTNKSSIEYRFTEQVQTYYTYYSMISSAIRFFPSICSLLFLSAYSDRAGRKYAIVPPIIGGFLYVTFYLIVISFKLSILFFWISSFVEGLFGGGSLLFVGCFAYIADITTKEQRRFRLTVVEMVPFFFGILGPIGVGYLIKKTGYFWPVAISVAGHTINLIYVIFFVPETIRKDPTVKIAPLSHIKESAKVLNIDTHDKRKWKLWVLLFTFLLHRLASGVFNIDSLFELNIPLCWDSVTIGYYHTVYIGVATIGALVSAYLLKYLMADTGIALLASIFDTLHCIYMGLVKNTIMMFFSSAFRPIGALLTPTTRALMSKLVNENEQGAVFGAVAIVDLVVELISSEGFKMLYANTLYISTGFVFFIGAIFYFLVCCTLIFYIVRLRKEEQNYQRLDTIE